MPWTEIIAGIVLIVWLLGMFGGSSRKSSGIWSGDTRDEEARRNTRTDSNYQGWERWQNDRSDKGW